jgi:hypothetical protein
MKSGPLLLIDVGCAVLVATPLARLAFAPPAPPASDTVAPRPPLPFPLNLQTVPPGQDILLGSAGANNSNPYGGPVPQWRLSIWSSSSADCCVLLITQDQYDAFVVANGTGFNDSVLSGLPTSHFWSSGLVNSTADTLLLGNGTWYKLVDNPGSSEISAEINSESCNAP